MDAIQFDQLPYECLKKIFECLSLRDRVECRAVSRQFKLHADQIEVHELVVSDDKSLDCKCDHWYSGNRPISNKNSISLEAFSFLNFSPLELDRQLTFLHIHLSNERLRWSRAGPDFKLLNGFKQLVHLEIKTKIQRVKSMTLALPNLKILNIREDNRQSALLFLKTPNLEILACDVLDGIQAVYPRRIKQLSCAFTGRNHMAKFKNLEVLDCQLPFLRDLDRIHLAYWKKLKELNVTFEFQSEADSEKFRSWLLNVVGQRTVLKKEQLNLYLNDVLLEDTEQLLECRETTLPGTQKGAKTIDPAKRFSTRFLQSK